VWAARANGGRCVYCDGKAAAECTLDPRFGVCKRCFAWLAAGNPMPRRGACARCKGEGIVDCGVCHNDGESERGCAACDDEGTMTCAVCKGTKTTTYFVESEANDDD